MFAILLCAAILGGGLVLLLARYGAPILLQKDHGAIDARPLMPESSLRALSVRLLSSLGLEVAEDPGAASDDRRLTATRSEPFGVTRYVVDLAPSPPGGVVDQAAVLALAEDVKNERATTGLLITPGRIQTAGLAGLDVTLQLIDGARFRKLIEEHLPGELLRLDHYRGFGSRSGAAFVEPLGRQPT